MAQNGHPVRSVMSASLIGRSGQALPDYPPLQCLADVPFFVEHCEAVAAEIDVKQRWLGEQARRGRSVWSGALPGRHVMLEVACEPSVVGSL